MRKLTLSFILFFTANCALLFAQNNTTGAAITANPSSENKVLVVPFEPRLYLSDIDNELAVKNEMSFKDIKAKFRAALDQNIYIALKQYYAPLSFYTIPEQDAVKELSYIYNSIGYKYEVLAEDEVVEKKGFGKKFLDKINNKEKEENNYQEAGIYSGEVKADVDNREKYMMTKITNDQLLTTLNQQYSASYYLFVNQLDIKRTVLNNTGLGQDGEREIKVHYTIFDAQQNIVNSGAIKTTFSKSETDINRISKNQFPLIAQKLVEKVLGEKVEEKE